MLGCRHRLQLKKYSQRWDWINIHNVLHTCCSHGTWNYFHFSSEDHWRAVFSPLGPTPVFRWRMHWCVKKASGLWKMSCTSHSDSAWNLPPPIYLSFRLLLIVLPAKLVIPKNQSLKEDHAQYLLFGSLY